MTGARHRTTRSMSTTLIEASRYRATRSSRSARTRCWKRNSTRDCLSSSRSIPRPCGAVPTPTTAGASTGGPWSWSRAGPATRWPHSSRHCPGAAGGAWPTIFGWSNRRRARTGDSCRDSTRLRWWPMGSDTRSSSIRRYPRRVGTNWASSNSMPGPSRWRFEQDDGQRGVRGRHSVETGGVRSLNSLAWNERQRETLAFVPWTGRCGWAGGGVGAPRAAR